MGSHEPNLFYTLALFKPIVPEIPSRPIPFTRSGMTARLASRALEQAEVLVHQLAIKGFGHLEVKCFEHGNKAFPEHGKLLSIGELRRKVEE